MSLAEFLKPTNWKLIFFVSLFVISGIEVGFLGDIIQTSIVFIYQDMILHPFSYLNFGFIPRDQFGNIVLFFTMIYWYILSCFIVWVFAKVTRKSEKSGSEED